MGLPASEEPRASEAEVQTMVLRREENSCADCVGADCHSRVVFIDLALIAKPVLGRREKIEVRS
jgi:hypothetical protein